MSFVVILSRISKMLYYGAIIPFLLKSSPISLDYRSLPMSTKSDAFLSVARNTNKSGPLVTLKFSNRINFMPSSRLISFAIPSALCMPSPAPTNSPDNADAEATGTCCSCCYCCSCALAICDCGWTIEIGPSNKIAIKPKIRIDIPFALFDIRFVVICVIETLCCSPK